MKLVTRSAFGWPASAAPSQSSTKGVKVHYEGTAVSTKLLTDHNACLAEWKNIRKSHLANTAEGYSDVAYNYAACPHGYLLEGRGLRKRTGANGNSSLNQAHYAILGLVGSSGLTEPNDAMLGAIRDGIDLLRKNGAGNEIKGHRDGYATTCPGAALYAWVQKGAPRTTEDDMPLTDDDVRKVWQTDGFYKNPNPDTAKANPFIAPATGLSNIEVVTRRTEARVATLAATNAELVKAVATLAAGLGDLDADRIVAELKAAIESIDVRLDVTP